MECSYFEVELLVSDFSFILKRDLINCVSSSQEKKLHCQPCLNYCTLDSDCKQIPLDWRILSNEFCSTEEKKIRYMIMIMYYCECKSDTERRCGGFHTHHNTHAPTLIFEASEWLKLPLQTSKPCFTVGLAHADRGGEYKQRVIYFIPALIRQLRGHVKLQFVSLASNKQLIHWSISHLSS